MPRKNEMSWEGKPAYRWVKMYKGVRYRVTCDELGVSITTEEASRTKANEWWRAKRAELDGPTPVQKILDAVEQVPVERLDEMIRRGQAARLILAEMPLDRVDNELVERIIGIGPIDDEERRADLLARVVGPALGGDTKTPPDRTFKVNVERFLTVIQGQVKPLTYREIRDWVRGLYTVPLLGAEMEVAAINTDKVREVFLLLKKADLSTGTKKKRWGFFKRLVRHFWEEGLIELPRNLDSDNFKFKVVTKAVKTYPISEVRDVLKGLSPRLRLYAMLGLNAGMTAADIGQMTKDMVNLTTARLVRKRVKTASVINVPTVNYMLWPETVELLRSEMSDHPTLFLTSQDGTALWESRQDGDKTPQKDLIYQQFKRAEVSIPHKAFRSISATLIESHAHFGRYKSHFLGQTPKTVADKHYAAPSDELFDQIMTWLRDKVMVS